MIEKLNKFKKIILIELFMLIILLIILSCTRDYIAFKLYSGLFVFFVGMIFQTIVIITISNYTIFDDDWNDRGRIIMGMYTIDKIVCKGCGGVHTNIIVSNPFIYCNYCNKTLNFDGEEIVIKNWISRMNEMGAK